jgi:DNA-binding response OmpR family regulator
MLCRAFVRRSSVVRGVQMLGPLVGRLVLVVEDEPLVALDVADALKSAGATVVIARTRGDAVRQAEAEGLSAAVLDHALADGDTSEVCESLEQRNIPFVIYSGYSKLKGPCSEGKLVHKPAHPQVLVSTLTGLLTQRPVAN